MLFAAQPSSFNRNNLVFRIYTLPHDDSTPVYHHLPSLPHQTFTCVCASYSAQRHGLDCIASLTFFPVPYHESGSGLVERLVVICRGRYRGCVVGVGTLGGEAPSIHPSFVTVPSTEWCRYRHARRPGTTGCHWPVAGYRRVLIGAHQRGRPSPTR